MKINENIVQILLSAIIGIAGLGVSYMRDLSKDVQSLKEVVIASRVETQSRFTHIEATLMDHEARLRAKNK